MKYIQNDLNSGFWKVFIGMESKSFIYLKFKHDISIFNLD